MVKNRRAATLGSLCRRGVLYYEIASVLSLRTEEVVHLCREHNLKHITTDPWRLNKIRGLLLRGLSHIAIANKMGFSASYIGQIKRMRGLMPKGYKKKPPVQAHHTEGGSAHRRFKKFKALVGVGVSYEEAGRYVGYKTKPMWTKAGANCGHPSGHRTIRSLVVSGEYDSILYEVI